MKRLRNILLNAAIILAALVAVGCFIAAARGDVPPLPVAPAAATQYHAASISHGAAGLMQRTVVVATVVPTVTVTMTPAAQLQESTDLATWTAVGEPTNQVTVAMAGNEYFRAQAGIVVSWEDVTNVAGYILCEYYQPTPQVEPWTNWDVGNVTNLWVPALTDGTNWFRVESYSTNEVDLDGNMIRSISTMTPAVCTVPILSILSIKQNQ